MAFWSPALNTYPALTAYSAAAASAAASQGTNSSGADVGLTSDQWADPSVLQGLLPHIEAEITQWVC
jgi:hypothetical protein